MFRPDLTHACIDHQCPELDPSVGCGAPLSPRRPGGCDLIGARVPGHPSLCCPSAPLGAGQPHHKQREGTGSMAGPVRTVIGGVDTHKDTHVVAALGEQGALLGTASFPTNLAGYAQLHDWLQDFGAITSVGIEGTGRNGCGDAGTAKVIRATLRQPAGPCSRARRWGYPSNVTVWSRRSACCGWPGVRR